jgi:hypothetical protein
LQPAPPWLDVELGLLFCGFEPTTNGQLRFDDFVRSRLSEPRSIVLSGGDLERLAVVTAVARGLGVSDVVVRSRTRIRAVTAARRLALLIWCGLC